MPSLATPGSQASSIKPPEVYLKKSHSKSNISRVLQQKSQKRYESKAQLKSKKKCSPCPSKKQVHGQFEGSGKNRKVYIEDLGVVDNFMASDDLNICVEALLHKRPKHNPASTLQTLPKKPTVQSCAEEARQ